jgi:uncharacterized OB-fold protein
MSIDAEVPVRREFAGFFDGIHAHSLRFPKCTDCGRHHWYPMQKCPHCGSDALRWEPVSGRGRLWSWTVVRHAYAPELRERLPYVVALVVFDDAPGVRLVTNLVDADPSALAIDMPVVPVFRTDVAGPGRVEFRPEGGAR